MKEKMTEKVKLRMTLEGILVYKVLPILEELLEEGKKKAVEGYVEHMRMWWKHEPLSQIPPSTIISEEKSQAEMYLKGSSK